MLRAWGVSVEERREPFLGGLTAASLLPTSSPDTPHTLYKLHNENCWAAKRGLKKIYQHAILSDSDVMPEAAKDSVKRVEAKFKKLGADRSVSVVEVKNGLDKMLSKLECSPLRLSVTEKYAPITLFKNGGQGDPFPGAGRSLLASPEARSTDVQPETDVLPVAAMLDILSIKQPPEMTGRSLFKPV